MKTIFIIQIHVEACEGFVFQQGYTTLEAAQRAIRQGFNNPEQRSDTVFRDKDYTYYYIEKVEVAL